jgi:hypothetical protein
MRIFHKMHSILYLLAHDLKPAKVSISFPNVLIDKKTDLFWTQLSGYDYYYYYLQRVWLNLYLIRINPTYLRHSSFSLSSYETDVLIERDESCNVYLTEIGIVFIRKEPFHNIIIRSYRWYSPELTINLIYIETIDWPFRTLAYDDWHGFFALSFSEEYEWHRKAQFHRKTQKKIKCLWFAPRIVSCIIIHLMKYSTTKAAWPTRYKAHWYTSH